MKKQSLVGGFRMTVTWIAVASIVATLITWSLAAALYLMEQNRGGESELPPLTKRALGLAKGTVPDDWDYKDVLSEALLEKYGA